MGNISRWLDVEVGTNDIDLNTLPSNIALVDLNNDGDFKLLVGDLGKGKEGPKLKVFKGALLVSEMALPDLPLGVVSCYTTETVPRSVPIVAVAFSSCIYIYRNMKLFYKYYLPSVELSSCELEIWEKLTNPANHNEQTIPGFTKSLSSIPETVLSNKSKHFLSLTVEQQLEFLESVNELPKKIVTDIACIATLKMCSVDKYAVSCLVVGTEDGEVVILDPQDFRPMSLAQLCTVKQTPYQMVTTGLYTVDYRITVATREKSVCLLKKGWKEGRLLFSTDEHIISMEVMTNDHSVMVICTDNTLACYSKKGKKQWSLMLEHRPVALTQVPVLALGATLVGAALASGHLHLYDGQARCDGMFVRDVVSVMKFGQLGQEEHVFIIVTATGNLMLKILKRTADFSPHSGGVAAPAAAPARPWHIPKKSRLFLEQAARERENAEDMHRRFQSELNGLRLSAARALLEAHAKSDNSVGAGALEPVRLAAEVEGLGPVFRVTLLVENASATRAVSGLAILFHVHTSNYKVSKPYIKVPLLPPGGKLRFPTKVEEVFEDLNPDVLFRGVTGSGGERALVRVLLVKEGRRAPVLAASVAMPPTDPMLVPYDKMDADAAVDFD